MLSARDADENCKLSLTKDKLELNDSVAWPRPVSKTLILVANDCENKLAYTPISCNEAEVLNKSAAKDEDIDSTLDASEAVASYTKFGNNTWPASVSTPSTPLTLLNFKVFK